MKNARVKDHEGWVRDMHSGAIVNTDANEFSKAMSARNRIIQNSNRLDMVEKKIDEIFEMLKKITSKQPVEKRSRKTETKDENEGVVSG
jgi:hypothetical protein